jgi:hypothetical protein
MNHYIAEIIKCKLSAVSFADKLAGLVRPTTHVLDKETVVYPVAYDVTHADCKIGQATELMPNSRYKSIMYFEDNGISAGAKQGTWQDMTSNLRLVVWLNLQKITDEKCPEVGSVCAVLEVMKALNNKLENAAPIFSILIDSLEIIRDKSIFSEYTYDEKFSQYLFHPYDFFAVKIRVKYKINYACTCEDNQPIGCYPAVPSILKNICVDPDSFAGTMQEGDCLRLPDFEDGKQYALKDGQWVEVVGGGGVTSHPDLSNLDFASSGHTGFEAAGAAAQALIDANNYTDTEIGLIPAPDLSGLLKLDQNPKQALTTSPIINNLTAGRFAFANTDKSLTDVSSVFWDTGLTALRANKVVTDNGSAAEPSVCFVDNTNMGLARTGSNLFALCVNGVAMTTFSSTQIRKGTSTIIGTAAAPLDTFAVDLDTGVFRPAANVWCVSTGGNEAVRLDANQNMKVAGSVQIGNNTALASETLKGTQRYREAANASYFEKCVKVNATTYQWKILNQENW